MARPTKVPETTAIKSPSSTARSVMPAERSIPALASVSGSTRRIPVGRAT